MKRIISFLACAIALGSAGQTPDASDNYVSKAEYLKLKAEHDQLKQQLETMQRQVSCQRFGSDKLPGRIGAPFRSSVAAAGPSPLPAGP